MVALTATGQCVAYMTLATAQSCVVSCAGVSGAVSVNGQVLTGGTMQQLCGYVLQDDVLPGTSTVAEYLRQVHPFTSH